ncbi:sulfurtransferase [Enterococcus canis]|uniref:Sulfurtransferase n=1 Tax=Enterococcus canis TaxID=214095 RepID=A0A1L8RIW3_9ENTE|nr:rhodanese-like domain-containing protein [Enterococcus canis]OJG19696.1 sulfurtransferase [Enterococcus canis]
MFWWIINGILLAFFLGLFLNWAFIQIMARRAAKIIKEDEFKEGMRTAQVIDVREKDSFDAGHILGARNMPYSLFKQSIGGLRKDRPVYLYDQKKALSARAANILRKNGFKDVYILKEGYDGWSGKTKRK